MGIQLCYNGYGWNPSTAHAAATPSNLYYYCHLRGQIWPLWSLDLSQARVPSRRGVGWAGRMAASTRVVFTVMNSLAIYFRMHFNAARPPGPTGQRAADQERVLQNWRKSVMQLLGGKGSPAWTWERPRWGSECPVITPQYSRGGGTGLAR